MVHVMRGGKEVKMSKRSGEQVTMRELIDWAGRDAVRFFLVSRKADSEFVFDVDLARQRSDENPVYYVQYAHARVCSVLAQWGGPPATLTSARLDALRGEREAALASLLMSFPTRWRRRRARRRRTTSPSTCANSRRSFTATIMRSASSSMMRSCAARASRSAPQSPNAGQRAVADWRQRPGEDVMAKATIANRTRRRSEGGSCSACSSACCSASPWRSRSRST